MGKEMNKQNIWNVLGDQFTAAAQLPVSRDTRRLIVAQPGYRRGTLMMLAITNHAGSVRLYVHVDGRWMDGSLADMCKVG